MIDRALLEQALDALERNVQHKYPLEFTKAIRLGQEAITALRAALEQQEIDWSLLEATQSSLREHMAEIRRLRALLEQALEALETDTVSLNAINNVAALLRAALEQPERPELRELLIGAAAMAVAAERKGVYQGASWVADAVLEQEEQTEQEPAARVLQTVGQYHNGRFVAEVETARRLRDGESLYTHPPRREWQGLTEEKIEVLNELRLTRQQFARAVKAALKEKNNG